jgi:hypothetical protein
MLVLCACYPNGSGILVIGLLFHSSYIKQYWVKTVISVRNLEKYGQFLALMRAMHFPLKSLTGGFYFISFLHFLCKNQ